MENENPDGQGLKVIPLNQMDPNQPLALPSTEITDQTATSNNDQPVQTLASNNEPPTKTPASNNEPPAKTPASTTEPPPDQEPPVDDVSGDDEIQKETEIAPQKESSSRTAMKGRKCKREGRRPAKTRASNNEPPAKTPTSNSEPPAKTPASTTEPPPDQEPTLDDVSSDDEIQKETEISTTAMKSRKRKREGRRPHQTWQSKHNISKRNRQCSSSPASNVEPINITVEESVDPGKL